MVKFYVCLCVYVRVCDQFTFQRILWHTCTLSQTNTARFEIFFTGCNNFSHPSMLLQHSTVYAFLPDR